MSLCTLPPPSGGPSLYSYSLCSLDCIVYIIRSTYISFFSRKIYTSKYMHFGVLLTPAVQPDIVETTYLSRRTFVVVSRLLWPCFVRVVVCCCCCCSLFNFVLVASIFAVCIFLQLKQWAHINRNLHSCFSLSKPSKRSENVVSQSWRMDIVDKNTTRRCFW